MSLGQSVAVPGTSDESSIENSMPSIEPGEPRIVGELVLDEAAGEPDQARPHAARIEKRIGHVEQPDDAVGRAEAAGRADFAAGVEADRHRDFDDVGARGGDVLLEHHQHLVEDGAADLLVALARLLRLGLDQPGFFEDLQVGRDG